MAQKHTLLQERGTLCSRNVDGRPCCKFCSGSLVRHGVSASGKIRFKCKACRRTQIFVYVYNAYRPEVNRQIITLTKEGLGIRSTARVLGISATTLLRRLAYIARNVKRPMICKDKTYEVDELRTFIKRKDKQVWVVCALERTSKKIVSFTIGPRTNKTLEIVLKTLRHADAKRIYTDGLQHYRYLIDQKIHRVDQFATNHIERKNLTLRTHLKRLNRRTICFSRSAAMLHACLMIYFFS